MPMSYVVTHCFHTKILLLLLVLHVCAQRTECVPTYTLLSSSKLYVNNKLPIDASSLIPANFSCIADSPTASLEWYINGQLLSAYEVFNISVRSTWPFTTNTSRIAYLSLTPKNGKGLQSMNISCGPSYGGGLTTENITLIWLRGAPTLLQGFPIAVQVTPHTLQFSWDGPLDDFIDYYIVTIQNGTDVLMFNTIGLQANLTFTCGVIYKCSVVPVNVVGHGNMSSSHHDTPCSLEGFRATSSIFIFPTTIPSNSSSSSATTMIVKAIILGSAGALVVLVITASVVVACVLVRWKERLVLLSCKPKSICTNNYAIEINTFHLEDCPAYDVVSTLTVPYGPRGTLCEWNKETSKS